MRLSRLRMRRPVLATLLWAFALFLFSTSASYSEDTKSFTGEWQTYWRHGQALLILNQQGDQVTGTFEPNRGKLEGRLEGRILRGKWEQPGGAGTFLFTLSEDGQTFTGRFDDGEYWNGRRADIETTRTARFSAAFSPRESLRTVIAAMNEVAFGGNSSASRFFEPLLIYEEDEGALLNATSRSRQRLAFWRLLNMSTFRIFDVPATPEGREATFTMGPAGSKVRYDLQFRLDDDDRWKIVVEPLTVINGVIDEVLADLGHASFEDFESARGTSPRATMRAFMEGTRNWDLGGDEDALATLDLSFLPAHLREAEGPILADSLRHIIDRAGYVVWQEIPNDPSRPTPLVHYHHPLGSVVIERIKGEEDEPDRWMFSAETLLSAPVLFNAIQDMPVADGSDELPPLTDFFRTRQHIRAISPALLHRDIVLENWQWIALMLTVVASVAAASLMARLVHAVLGRFAGENAARGIAWPIRLSVAGGVLLIVSGKLGIGQSGLSAAGQALAVLTILGLTMLLYRITGLIGGIFIGRASQTPGYIDEIVASLATGLTKLLVVLFGIVACADIIGLPYEGVITGLGVGGVALAFASRDTVSNILGGVLLMADRPFKRGDLIETEGQFARIEDVGLRSTRLKTLEDSILIIPNAQLSDKAIVNWGKRRRRKVEFDIGFTYDTPREKLDLFVEQLTALYAKQPHADAGEYYIGLRKFGASSIDIEFWGYFNVIGRKAHVRARHAFIGDVIDLARTLGLSFAFPTRTVHMMMEDQPHNPSDPDGRGLGDPEKEGDRDA
jgi:MscS family membrane protein